MNFGDNLKQLRKTKKVSQEELAEKLGVSRQSISKWETGENYPSMTNIMCLCDIFHCKINDIVHEDFEDINSLDPEIKMKVVKLKEKEQKRMKVLSKILEIVALVGKVLTRVAAVVVLLVTVAIPIFFANVKYSNNTVKFNFTDETITFVETNNKVKAYDKENKEIKEITPKFAKTVKKSFDNNKVTTLSIKLTLGFICLTIYLFIISIILRNVERLFKNINRGETPFTLENVSYIKKTAYYMIVAIIVSSCGAGILDTIAGDNSLAVDSFDLIEILFLFAMAYIFEYGVEIQKDSEGVMYNEEK